jgi:hypothetical protein
MAFDLVVLDLDLHARHVDAGRAFPLAALAGDTELQGLGHCLGGHGVGAQLAGEGQAQAVGPAPGQVLLVPGHPERRTHDPGVELAAGAVVVAHLHRAGEAVPLRPVQRGLQLGRVVVRLVAEQATVIHGRRVDDLARVEQALGIEAGLHLGKVLHHAGPEHGLVELRADQAVAVLPGVGTLVVADHGEGLLGDRPHLLDVGPVLHVEHRAHMQAADRGMGVPGARGAVLLEHLGQPVGVVGQVLQADRAVLDERHRFTVALHGHHDVEAGLTDFPDGLLEGRIDGLHDSAGKAQVGHGLAKVLQAAKLLVPVLAGELHQQQAFRRPLDHPLDGRPIERNVARQVDHGAIHQLHRAGLQLYQVPGRVHGRVEPWEMADPQDPVRGDRVQLQLDPGGERQGALGAHQEMGQVRQALARHQGIDVVAAHPAHEIGEAPVDLPGLALAQGQQVGHQVPLGRGPVAVGEIRRYFAETHSLAVGQHPVDGAHVVAHGAVADRAGAAGVVAGHAADGGPAAGGDVDREPQPVGPEKAVQLVQHHARLDRDPLGFRLEVEHFVQVLGDVDHQGRAHGLAALGGAGTPGQDRNARLGRDSHGTQRVLGAGRHHHPDRLDLVDRGVGAVAAPAEAVEQHLALQLVPQPRRQRTVVYPVGSLGLGHTAVRHRRSRRSLCARSLYQWPRIGLS